ncbi:MAG: NUDIX domain-containing protein [Alphaproteobacteria bacterium]|nr:NUDIX domain-containing protein [Alphaproteobacteria bacterium]
MTAVASSFVAEEDVGIRTSAAILVTPDDRYLMQLRDDKAGVSFPDTLCLFGGALEPGEDPEAGLRRELREELELEAGETRYFTQLVFDAIYADGTLRQRYFFEVPIEPGVIDGLVLHEGAAMRLMTADDMAEESFRFVPYDFGILRMHMLLRRNEGGILGTKNGLSADRS